jgi:glucose-1-phosphate thymidylyltransferase
VKGVVLAGGTGSRLRPITYSMAKQLVPIANKPILFYGLEHLAAAGVTDVGIVTSPQTGPDIAAAVGDGSAFGIDVTYIRQEEPLGLAHALATAAPFIGGDDVLMYLGDNLVKEGIGEIVADFARHRPNCQILLSETDHPERFGVVELDHDGSVSRLVEKPEAPATNLALVGVYLFDESVTEALTAIRPSARGEYEITDAIQFLVDAGRRVRATQVGGWWKDTGHKDDLIHANELVLADLEDDRKGTIEGGSITGSLRLGERSTLRDCEVTGPVAIGTDVIAERSTIGPHTSIGDGARLTDCRIETSILLPGVRVDGWRLHASVAGAESQLLGPAPDATVEITVGERSRIAGR